MTYRARRFDTASNLAGTAQLCIEKMVLVQLGAYVALDLLASLCTLTSSILELANRCCLEVNAVEDKTFFCPKLERLNDPDSKRR